MDKKKIAWCITGSGHYLKESIELLLTLENVDLYLSKAGEEVLKWYNYDLYVDYIRSHGRDAVANAEIRMVLTQLNLNDDVTKYIGEFI